MQGKLFAIVGVQQEYVLKESEKDVIEYLEDSFHWHWVIFIINMPYVLARLSEINVQNIISFAHF